MNAQEIIAQIEALPPEEKALVVDYVRKIKAELEAIRGNKEIRYVSESDFQKAQEEVFTKYAALFKRLAES